MVAPKATVVPIRLQPIRAIMGRLIMPRAAPPTYWRNVCPPLGSGFLSLNATRKATGSAASGR